MSLRGLLVPVLFGRVPLLLVSVKNHASRGLLSGIMLAMSPFINGWDGRLLFFAVSMGQFRRCDTASDTGARCEARIGTLIVGAVGNRRGGK